MGKVLPPPTATKQRWQPASQVVQVLEAVPCNGNANLTSEQRTIILDAAKCKGDIDE